MAVAGNDDGVGLRPADQVVEALAVDRVAVPHVQAIGQAQLRDPGHAVDALYAVRAEVRRGGSELVRAQGGAQVGHIHPGHDHLIAEHLPGAAGLHGVGKAPAQPVGLGRTHHAAVRVGQALAEPDDVRLAIRAVQVGGVVQLQVPGGQPGLEHEEGGEVAELEGPVDGEAAAVGFADGHPLVIGLDGRRLAAVPGTFVLLVVLGAVRPGVVGGLMVVPDDDPGGPGMGRLELGIGLGLGVPVAIVPKGEDLVVRLDPATQLLARFSAVALGSVLVDVVAQVEDDIDPRQVGDGLVGIEVPGLPEGAGSDGHDGVLDLAFGQGAGAAHGRGHAVRCEGEGVGPARIEAADIDLDGEVLGRRGRSPARLRATGSPVDGVEAPRVGDGTAGGIQGRDAGPEDDAVAGGIPRGDPVVEPDLAGPLGGGTSTGGDASGPEQGEGPATIHAHVLKVPLGGPCGRHTCPVVLKTPDDDTVSRPSGPCGGVAGWDSWPDDRYVPPAR